MVVLRVRCGVDVVVAVQERLEASARSGCWSRPGRRPIRGRGCGGSARPCRWSGGGRAGSVCVGSSTRPARRRSEGSVAGAVVGEHSVDAADAVAAEELHRPRPERRPRWRPSRRAALRCRPAGSGRRGGVQVDVAGAGAGVLGPLGGLVLGRAAAVDPPAAAVRDPADLLHIDMHQVPGTGPLVAEDRFAQVLPGDVEVAQPGDPASNQHPVDRRGRHPRSCSSARIPPSWTGPTLRSRRSCSIRSSTSTGVCCGELAGRDDRSYRPSSPDSAIGHTTCPASAGRSRPRRRLTDLAAGVDPFTQPATTFRSQRSITVGHDGAFLLGVCLVASHLTRRTPSLNQPRRLSPTSLGRTADM